MVPHYFYKRRGGQRTRLTGGIKWKFGHMLYKRTSLHVILPPTFVGVVYMCLSIHQIPGFTGSFSSQTLVIYYHMFSI
jgi:hypothetical protein